MAKQQTRRLRLAEKRKRIRRIKLLVFVSVLVLLYAGGGYVSTLPESRINYINVNIDGATKKLNNSVEILAQQSLASVRWKVFFAGTVATFDESLLKDKILDKYPELLNIDIKIKDAHGIAISGIVRDEVAIWCGDGDNQECYSLDKDGLLFKKLVVNNTDKVVYKGEIDGILLKSRFLPNTFAQVQELVNSLNHKFDADVRTVRYNEDDDKLIILSNNLPDLIIKHKFDTQDILSYLKVTINSEDFKKVSSESGVKYIDLRFGNRIYFK